MHNIPMSSPDITAAEIEEEGKAEERRALTCAMNSKRYPPSGIALLLGGLLALGVVAGSTQ